MSGERISVATEEGVLVVRLSRPEKANALGKEDLTRIASVLRDARDVTGAVIVGAGVNFSAGFDLDELTGGSTDDEIDDLLAALERAIEESSYPVVAAVEGACVGAGCDLAVMCDAIVAGEGAFFAIPAVRLGVLYRTAAVREVVRRAGPQAAALLFLFGERMSARAARAAGLISEVVPDGGAGVRARELVAAAGLGVPGAVAATKKLIRALRTGEADATAFDELGRMLSVSAERVRAIGEARGTQ